MATYGNAEDRYITVGNIKFAYRKLGNAPGVPLVLLMHFRGTMDHWDPALVNPLARGRTVYMIDNAGVGRSTGEIPTDYIDWAKHYLNVVAALKLAKIDIIGFSMGGCVAQMVALEAPHIVRKVVLCGTTPSIGGGVVRADPNRFKHLNGALTDEQQKRSFLETMFSTSENCRKEGEAAWKRITEARPNRVKHVDLAGARRQARAMMNFMDEKQKAKGSFDRLHELKMPILIANGCDDLLLPTENSILLYKKLSHAKAQLHLFPDSGHGFLYQFGPEFAGIIVNFLDSDPQRESKL